MSSSQSAPSRSGWTTFAIVLFFVLGAINIIYGLAMLANAEFVVFTPDAAWLVDITVWGWITLLLGLVEVFVGWALTNNSQFARVTGIVLVALAAINAFFVIPIYAPWGIVALTVSLMALYGLVAATSD